MNYQLTDYEWYLKTHPGIGIIDKYNRIIYNDSCKGYNSNHRHNNNEGQIDQVRIWDIDIDKERKQSKLAVGISYDFNIHPKSKEELKLYNFHINYINLNFYVCV